MRLRAGGSAGLAALLLALVLPACGGDETARTAADVGADASGDATLDGGPDLAPACLSADSAPPPVIQGRVYEDVDGSDRDRYLEAFDEGIDTPLPAHTVTLRSAGAPVTGETCADGTFAFGGLSDGIYLVDPSLPEVGWPTTNNGAHRLLRAMDEGHVQIVTFGDSIPVVGDAPFYPERLATLLGALTSVDQTNVAVGGSTSEDWLPGGDFFENRLRPELPDADVVLISLGGNDALSYLGNSLSQPGGITEALNHLDDFTLQVLDRIRTIVAEIRSVNPDVDIVYGIYPDYTDSDRWHQLLGPFITVAGDALRQALDVLRNSITSGDRFIVVDLYEATRNLHLDDYLYDQLHLNAAGQQLYAEEILTALGGARVGDAPLGLVQDFGLPASTEP